MRGRGEIMIMVCDYFFSLYLLLFAFLSLLSLYYSFCMSVSLIFCLSVPVCLFCPFSCLSVSPCLFVWAPRWASLSCRPARGSTTRVIYLASRPLCLATTVRGSHGAFIHYTAALFSFRTTSLRFLPPSPPAFINPTNQESFQPSLIFNLLQWFQFKREITASFVLIS